MIYNYNSDFYLNIVNILYIVFDLIPLTLIIFLKL